MEILKNLILEGPHRVDIYDPNNITINDLNSNFFVNEKDVNRVRDEIIVEKIKDLNPNVESKVIKQNIRIEDNNYKDELHFILSNISNYNIIIITEPIFKDTIIKINNECRKLNKKMIYTCALGLAGFLFNDFGKNHIISSPYDKDDKYYPIKNIKKGIKTIIQLENSLEGFPNLEDNGYIKIRDVKGMPELNDIIFKVKFISLSEYEIDVNSINFNDYTYGGFIQIISLPKNLEFKTFEEDILDPMKNKEREIIDIPYIGRSDIVHSLIISLHNKNPKFNNIIHKKSYIIDSQLLPELNDEENANILAESAKIFYNIAKEKKKKWIQIEDLYDEDSEQKEFDEEMAKNLCLYLRAELPPIVSFLGGVVAQEVIKITGKFSPFNQWFEFEFYYLSKEIKNQPDEEIKEISRYYEQIKIFGQEVQTKLSSLNVFLIGAGAIGCEYIKNFSMMGIACKNNNNSKNGVITITDFDRIELSNLNRQFLFRENNIGQFKSEVCKYFAKQMNNTININSYRYLVSSETESIFSDVFWDNQNIIFNAVDNIKARMYINEKVTIHQKYHFDAGTLGVHSNCCIFLKNVSSTYKEQNEDKKEDDLNNRENGMCTIHSFPTSIKHCIQWARNEFEYEFKEFINELNQILKGDSQYLYKTLLKSFSYYKNIKLNEITNFFDILTSKSYEKAIKYAYTNFKKKFYFEIKKILKEHPIHSKNSNGKNFYSGSKHIPIVLDFNINDEIDNLIICYIKSYANLIFNNLDLIKSEKDKNLGSKTIKEICLKVVLPNDESINEKEKNLKIKYDKIFCQNFINDLHNKLMNQLSLKSLEKIQLKEINFEKDNMKNSQFDFIYACSNLKALNFQIPQSDFLKIKNISSNIVPSIVTSNAVITGLASIQLYLLAKLLIEKEKYNNNTLETEKALKLFRNYYINIGINGYSYSYLPKKILHNEIIDIPKDWSVWDSIIFNGPLKVSELINKIEEKYNVLIKSIYSGKSMIYNDDDQKEIKNLKIEELFEKITEKSINENNKYLIFNLIANTKNGNEVRMPRIKYILNNN